MTRRRRSGHTRLRHLAAAIFAAVFVCVCTAEADDVTITSQGGSLALTGRLIGYDGTYLVVESQYGPLTLPYAQVICDGAACPDADTWVPMLRLSGASRMTDVLVPALIDGFARSQGWQATVATAGGPLQELVLMSDSGVEGRFKITTTSSDEAFADLVTHTADMALTLRAARPDEVVRASEIGIGDLNGPQQARLIALDGLIPVASTDLSLGVVTLDDLARLMTETSPGLADVSLHLPQAGLADHVMAILGVDPATVSPSVEFHPDTNSVMDQVAAQTTAIGLVGHDEIGLAQPIPFVGTCGVALNATRETLKTEDYPLTAPLYIYMPDRRLPELARDFLAYLRTPAAQLIVRRAGFVDQGAIPIPLDAQGQRFARAIALAGNETTLVELQRLVSTLDGFTRYSLSFRFEAASSRLDAPSRSNLLMLAEMIESGNFDGRQLLLVGFSDGDGSADDNRALSRRRAEVVAADLDAILLAMAAPPPEGQITVAAFGEALPIGCDETPWGRRMNRRVELWVSD